MNHQNTEAKKALDTLLTAIGECQRDIDSLKDWSLVDLFGGNFFMSSVKRDKITKLNQKLEALNQLINISHDVMEDSPFSLIPYISNTKYDRLWDIWADNIVKDWRVREEIETISEQVTQLKEKARDLLDSLV